MTRWLERNREWVITEHYFGRAGRWFRYHPRRVWTWTTKPHLAARFRSEADARQAADNCEVSWRHDIVIEARRKHR